MQGDSRGEALERRGGEKLWGGPGRAIIRLAPVVRIRESRGKIPHISRGERHVAPLSAWQKTAKRTSVYWLEGDYLTWNGDSADKDEEDRGGTRGLERYAQKTKKGVLIDNTAAKMQRICSGTQAPGGDWR